MQWGEFSSTLTSADNEVEWKVTANKINASIILVVCLIAAKKEKEEVVYHPNKCPNPMQIARLKPPF